jgi:hypothetical protein
MTGKFITLAPWVESNLVSSPDCFSGLVITTPLPDRGFVSIPFIGFPAVCPDK